MTAASFYVTGGTLRQDAPSYVERQADQDLYEGLSRGEFCYVLTSRQMGKSSLMVRTAARLREAGVAVAVLDLTAVGQNLTPDQWYGGLLRTLGRQLDPSSALEDELDEFWLAEERLGPLQRWLIALQQIVLPAVGVQAFRRSGVQGGPTSGPERLNAPDHRAAAPGTGPAASRPPSPKRPRRLVIFLDEIDVVRGLPFSTDEFFAGIRECYNRRAEDPEFERLTFCLLGVASPSDLIRDTRLTPFNIGKRIELTDFSAGEAAPLAGGLVPAAIHEGAGAEGVGNRSAATQGGGEEREGPEESGNRSAATQGGGEEREGPEESGKRKGSSQSGSGEPLFVFPASAKLLQRVLHWTGGHPYLTQRLCGSVAEATADNPKSKRPDPPPCVAALPWRSFLAVPALRAPARNPKSTVDRLCAGLFLSASAREKDDNLLFVRECLLRSEADLASLLDLYRRVRAGQRVAADDTNPLVDRLRLSGVIKLSGSRLVVRNRIYARVFDRAWVDTHMPDAELRRQRAAFRRGLVRAGAVAGVVLALMGGLTLTAVRYAHRAETVSAESLRRLVRLNLYTGERAIDEGDPLGALPWFAEALRLEQGNPEREEMHRYRLGALLRQCPQVVRFWSPGKYILSSIAWTGIQRTRNYRRVILQSGEDTIRVWDTLADAAVGPPLKHGTRLQAASLSPDGQRAATVGRDGTVRAWDVSTGRPLAPRMRHKGAYEALFSPDGSRLVTTSHAPANYGEATAQVWDVATGRPIGQPLRHQGSVTGAAFSPDGRRVATGSTDQTARVWDAATGRPLTPPLKQSGWVTWVVFSADGRRLLTGMYWRNTPQEYARVWDAETGRPLTPPLFQPGTIGQVSFSPDGRRVLTPCQDGTTREWDAATGRLLVSLKHRGPTYVAAFSEDGRRVATASEDRTARVWDAATGEPLTPPLPLSGAGVLVSFREAGRVLVTMDDAGTLRHWDLNTNEAFETTSPHAGRVSSASFSPDGRRVLTAGFDDGTARVWDAATGELATAPLSHKNGIARAAFSPDGRRIVTASWDGTARVWDAATGQPVAPPLRHPQQLISAAFSPEGRRVVTTCQDETARVWDLATGRLIGQPMKAVGIIEGLGVCAFSPDGHRVVTGCREGACAWDAATGRLLKQFAQQRLGVFSAAGYPRSGWGRLLTWGGANDALTARVWDAVSLQPLGPLLQQPAAIVTAALSPDGHRVATGSAGEARVWDAATGRALTPPLPYTVSGALGIAFSPDGRRVLTGGGPLGSEWSGADPLVHLWDAATGEPLTAPLRHRSPVYLAAFSPDGRRLLTGCADGTIRIWDVSPAEQPLPELLLRAQVQAGRRIDATGGAVTLTPEELRRDWQALRASLPDGRGSAFLPALIWHRREAAACERDGQWALAIRHLDPLLAANPTDPLLSARRASAYAALGEWERADADLTRSLARWPTSPDLPYAHALVHLARGDSDSYRRTCVTVAARVGEGSPALVDEMERVVWLCTLAPEARPTLPHLVALSKKILWGAPAYGVSQTLGFLSYRAGRYEEAVTHLQEAIAWNEAGGAPQDWLFLAMAYRKLGQVGEARQCLVKAAARHDGPAGASPPWQERLEVELLRREARSLIPPSNP